MFFKSLILGAVCAFMAGGAVYFSTLPATEMNASFDRQNSLIPQVENELPKANVSVLENTKDTHPSPQKDVQYEYEPEREEPKASGPRRWLDQYLKRKTEPEQTPRVDVEQDSIQITGQADDAADIPSLAGTGSLTGTGSEANQDGQSNRYAYEDIQSNQNGSLAPSSGAVNNQMREMEPSDTIKNTDMADRKRFPYINETGNVDNNIQIAMREIEKISAPRISEQAYFSLVSYALSHGRFSAAEAAMDRIMTVEMRETARINMAVALAKTGQSTEAFAMVNAIEAPEYRDILRLQVIEALLEHKDANPGR